MANNIIFNIKLTSAGNCSGPVDLYSNVDNYGTAFETGVSITQLTSTLGYNTSNVPAGTIIIRIQNANTNHACNDNYVDVSLPGTDYTEGYYFDSTPYNSSGEGCIAGDDTDSQYFHNGIVIGNLYIPPEGSFLYDFSDPVGATLLNLTPGWYGIANDTNTPATAMILIGSNGYEVECCNVICP